MHGRLFRTFGIAGLALAAQLSALPAGGAEIIDDWYYWVLDGKMQVGSRPGLGHTVYFSCTADAREGAIFVEIGGQPVADGPVSFEVDGKAIAMSVAGGAGEVTTDCAGCGDRFVELWRSIAAGQTMTVIPAGSAPVEVSLKGAGRALAGEPCAPKHRS